MIERGGSVTYKSEEMKPARMRSNPRIPFGEFNGARVTVR